MLGLGIGSAVAVGAEILNLALSGVKASRLSAEEAAARDEIWKSQFRVPAGLPDNHPGNIHATVKLNGEIVATIYNSGAVAALNGAAARLMNLPSMGEGESRTGPMLAEARAKEIAEVLGGKIAKADTALTQSEWQNRPAAQVTYDQEAMERARQARAISARTLFDAQSIGQKG